MRTMPDDEERDEAAPKPAEFAEEPLADAAAPGGPDDEEDDEGDGVEEEANVTPEEQQLYENVVIAAQSLLYADVSQDAVLQKLRDEGRQRPAFAIGHTAAMLLQSVRAEAESQGVEIPDDVLLAAGEELVSEVLDIAVAARLVGKADKEKVYQDAMLEGTKAFGEADLANKRLTPEVQSKARAQMHRWLSMAPKGGAAPAKAPGGKPGFIDGQMAKLQEA